MFSDNNTFQEVIPGLFIGSQSALLSPYPLIAQKITHLLGINNCKEKLIGFKMKIMSIEDNEDADIISCFQECIDFIKSAKKVLVFCAAGRSRSAAVVAAYLIKEKQMSLSEALITINRVRAVRPNEGFIEQLMDWEKISGCRICRALAQSSKILQEEEFFIVACQSCQLPVAILKEHSARKSSDLTVVVMNAIEEVVKNFYVQKACRIKLCRDGHVAWHAFFENEGCAFANM